MSLEQPRHSKRSFTKWPTGRSVDSPAYDAYVSLNIQFDALTFPRSEEDNDPLTDGDGSVTPSLGVTPCKEVPDPLSATRALDPESQQPVFISQPESPVSPLSSAANPASFTADDIQAFVKRAIAGEPARTYKINPPPVGRPIRIYADGAFISFCLLCHSHFCHVFLGVYDLFHFGYVLLRFLATGRP